MYHLDKLLGHDNDAVAFDRLRKVSRDVGMLAPRAGTFKGPSGKVYKTQYEGEEVLVYPADVVAMMKHGFKDIGIASKSLPNDILRKRGLLGHLDGSHSRIEFGSAPVEHGLIKVALDTASDTLNVHGIAHPMASLAAGTRAAIYATAAQFNMTENQARQRIVLGALVDAAMARDKELSDRVKSEVMRQRYE